MRVGCVASILVIKRMDLDKERLLLNRKIRCKPDLFWNEDTFEISVWLSRWWHVAIILPAIRRAPLMSPVYKQWTIPGAAFDFDLDHEHQILSLD